MKAEILSQFPLFAGVPDSEILAFAERLQACDSLAGSILFAEGSITDHFFIILEGEVEVVKSLGTADERVIATSGKGEMLGEMGMFSRDGSHTASVRARTPLKMLMITFNQFDALLHRHPDMAYDMLRLYSSRLQQSENMTILDLREKNRQLTDAYQELQAAQAVMIEKEKLEHELQIAAEIQRGVLPESLPEQSLLDFGALMIPARAVGGDFYDIIPLDQDRIGIVVGDVCDKGMPAALFMALTYSSLRTEALRQDDPGNTLRAVNEHLLQINRSNMFVTLLYGILDCRTCQFTYARAGHPEPLLLDGDSQPVNVPSRLGQPLGLFEHSLIDQERITIPAQGTMLVYSDGLSETIEGNKQFPALPDLCKTILAERGLKAQELCNRLWRTVGGSAGESLIQDDFTLVWVRNLQT